MRETTSLTAFRTDVNGLRAWAVISVILFHFQVPGFSGGFVGVDIFFVISGFLMTGIIVGKLESGQFSIIDFYLARAKRIIPALLVLCVVLLGCGWFFLQSPDYKTLAIHAVYSLTFSSNNRYLQEAGYFDAASHEKWLLHTWSLSVEWQFYLALPIALGLVWKLFPGRSMTTWIIWIAALVSLGACVLVTQGHPASAFFLLPYRAWEMLAGGIVFLSSMRPTAPLVSRALNGIGLVLIITAIFAFDKDSAWPGIRALLPVLGASMVVLANRDSVWTSNRIAQWLGDRSYSLYLWHWPLYVAMVFSEQQSNAAVLAAGLSLTLLLGHVSYALVEVRSRRWLANMSIWKTTGALVVCLAAAAVPATLIWRVQGWPGRFPEAVEKIALEAGNSNVRRKECHTLVGTTASGCRYGHGSKSAIVLGDSHADAVVTSVARAADGSDTAVEQMSYSGCPFVFGLKLSERFMARQPKQYKCAEFIESLRSEFATQHKNVPVILVGRYSSVAFGTTNPADPPSRPQVHFIRNYAAPDPEFFKEFSDAIVETACELARHRQVYLVRPIPEMGLSVPKAMSRRASIGVDSEYSVSLADYHRRNSWVWKAQDVARERCNVKILDTTRYLCRDGRCYGSMGGKPLYYDNNHLSEYGNKLLVPMFREVFRPKES